MTQLKEIPLALLDVSATNARKTFTKDGIEQLAANIAAIGLLQNLQVTPNGDRFEVIAGGRRLAALQLLAKQGKIAADFAVPCNIQMGDQPALTEISLAENEVRENMHPADQFEAFRKLADAGQGDETIAARFGVTPHTVKQRLKLATVSPKLIAAFRKEEMTLEQLMAFTLTDDHKTQLKVWADLPAWAKQRGDDRSIREALTAEQAAADSKLAKFVGIEAYERAGGHINRDLFDPENAGYLTDLALLNRLVAEKLETAAATVRAEGWKWVDAAPVFPWEQTQKDHQIHAAKAEIAPEQQAKIDKLQAKVDALHEKHGDEPEDNAICDRLEALNEQIEALSETDDLWSDEQKAVSGVYVSIGHNAEVMIKRGVVKPEDKAAARKIVNPAGQGGDADEPDETAAKPKGGVPASLIAELTAHKTIAAQLMLAQNAEAALLAVTHALAVRLFYPYGGSSSLGISAHRPVFGAAYRDEVVKSASAKKLTGIVKSWEKALPKEPDELWAYLAKQKPERLQSLLAVCAALTIDLVQVNGAPAKACAQELCKAVKLDMADHWTATAESYFTRVPRKHLLGELNGELQPNTRKQVESMKRDMAAKTIATELKGKRWLPEVLRL